VKKEKPGTGQLRSGGCHVRSKQLGQLSGIFQVGPCAHCECVHANSDLLEFIDVYCPSRRRSGIYPTARLRVPLPFYSIPIKIRARPDVGDRLSNLCSIRDWLKIWATTSHVVVANPRARVSIGGAHAEQCLPPSCLGSLTRMGDCSRIAERPPGQPSRCATFVRLRSKTPW
jgi:hypothetical protein